MFWARCYVLNIPSEVLLLMEDNILKTGTTTIAMLCKEGIILAADRRATAGTMIVDKKAKKIHTIAKKMALTTSGSVSDLQLLTKIVTAELSLKRYRTELESSTDEAANLLAGLVYSNIRRLTMIPGITHFILGGHDSNGFRIYDIFADGSISEVDTYYSSGSGSVFALGVLDTLYKEEMSAKDAIALTKKALNAALQRDSATGEGLDIVHITAKDIKEVVSKELKLEIE